MKELSDIVKKTLMGLGILGITCVSLEAQQKTGSNYLRGLKKDDYSVYCSTKKGRSMNMNKYKKLENENFYCNFDSKKHFNSNKYKPKAYLTKDNCVLENYKKYVKEYNKIKRKLD